MELLLIICKQNIIKMKKVLMMLSAFMVASLVVNAQGAAKQDPPHKPPTVEERLKHLKEVMVKDASLNEEKQQKIAEVFKQFFIKADKLNPPPPPPPNKEEMDKLVKERDEAVAKILTADEFKRYKEAEKKLRPPHPPQPKEGEGAPPPPPPKDK